MLAGFRSRRTLVQAVSFVALVGLAAVSSALAYEPPSVAELEDQLARREATARNDPPHGDILVVDSRLGPDPSAPTSILTDVMEAYEALVDSSESSFQKHLKRAKQATEAAFQAYGISEDLGVVFSHLKEAAQNLQAAANKKDPHYAEVNRLAAQLTVAAEGIASKLVVHARSVGVNEKELRQIAKKFENGEKSFQAQNYVAAIGQFGGATDFAANVMQFDIDLFEENLHDALAGNTVGYALSIGLNGEHYDNGVPDFGGLARTAVDDGVDQTATKAMNIASITKTISAVGLQIALAEAGLSVDDSISPYLPESWVQGENVDSITFRYLMTHQTGLDESGNQTLAELQQAIASGTDGLLAFSGAKYTNTNFSLIRVLIPQIVVGQDVIDAYTVVLPADQVYAGLYEDYIYANVLAPAGIDSPTCAPREDTGTRTLYYVFGAPPATPGFDIGDWWLSCGATGYYLSAVELGSLMAHLRYTDDIIDESIRDQMDNGFLGWLNPKTYAGLVVTDETEGIWGVYRGHGGDSANSNAVPGMTSCMMKFPIEVEAAVLVNSRGNDFNGHLCTVLRLAYDNAWVAG